MSLPMKKTHQKPNKAMKRRADRMKERGIRKSGSKFMDLKSWQEYQQRLADQREAQEVYERVHAEIQKKSCLSAQAGKTIAPDRFQPSGLESS